MTDSEGAESEGFLSAYVPAATEAGPARARPPWRKAGIAIGVVVALVAGLFGLASLNSDGGQDSPEAAVRKLVDALENEDVLGALEAIVSGERAVLRGRIKEVAGQLRRLGILDDRLDLGHVPGADVTVQGLRLNTERLGDDVAAVRAESGTARLRIKGEELPLGPLLKDVVEDPGSISSPPPADLSEDDVMLVAVRRDGHWFVSFGYTIAELARRDGGAPVPKFGRGIAPKGAASPEAAVREVAAAAAGLDVRRLIELTPPGEADALHDYGPLFMPGAERVVASLREEGVRAEMPVLDLEVESSGDGEARVTLKRLVVNVVTGDDRFSFNYDGRCVSLSGSEGELLPRFCRDDRNEQMPFSKSSFSYFTLSSVERDGDWFVSPTGSVLDAVLVSLRALEREELARVVREQPFALFFLFFPSPFLLGGITVDGSSGSSEEAVTAVPPAVSVAPAPRPTPTPTTGRGQEVPQQPPPRAQAP